MKEPFDRWLALAEEQLEAARKVDPERLSMATETRRRLQDQMAAHDVTRLVGEDREYAVAVARRIRDIDLRIQQCGHAVMATLDAVLPDSGPRTYGRRGQLRGV